MWIPLLLLFLAGQESPSPRTTENPGSDRLKIHVEALSDDELEGRNAGSRGARRAAKYIVQRFREYGLLPGPGGSHVQRFSFLLSDLEGTRSLQPSRGKGINIVGLVEGSSRSDEVVMVISHFDHLGKSGQPNPGRWAEKKGDPVWNGANDNATGVAGLLVIAEEIAAAKPERTFLFVAFSAKEHGVQGSLWYRENPLVPLEQVVFVLTLDRIGRFGEFSPQIHGVGTGKGLRPIVEDVLEGESLPAKIFNHADVRHPNGDQVHFYQAGIPTLLMTVSPHGTDRTSGDHAGTVRYPDLEKMVRSALGILRKVDRVAEPFPFVKGRRFGFLQGGPVSFAVAQKARLEKEEGAILVMEVKKDSIAARAGLEKGDWILSLNGVPLPKIGPLLVFRRIFDAVPAGGPVSVVVFRGGKRVTMTAEWSE